jgi:hypothetical protein
MMHFLAFAVTFGLTSLITVRVGHWPSVQRVPSHVLSNFPDDAVGTASTNDFCKEAVGTC